MHVVFALRSDALTKPGGDTKKVDRFREELSKLNISSEVVTSRASLLRAKADICHLVNLDLPVENYRYASAAKARGIPVALSSVSHPIAGLTAMYDRSDDWFFHYLRRISIRAEIGLGVRERAKLLARRQILGWPMSLGLTRSQQALIDSVDLLLPMADGELEELSRRFERLPSVAIVPNGMSFDWVTPDGDREDAIALIGRIEPRKNSLEMAQALSQEGLTAVFAGQLNPKHKRYASTFLQVVRNSPNLSYLGELNRADVQALVLRVKYYANPSWCEVVSQADVEAYMSGCQVVSTKYSYLADILGDVYGRVDPMRVSHRGGKERIRELLSRPHVRKKPELFTWSESAAILRTAYVRLLEGRA